VVENSLACIGNDKSNQIVGELNKWVETRNYHKLIIVIFFFNSHLLEKCCEIALFQEKMMVKVHMSTARGPESNSGFFRAHSYFLYVGLRIELIFYSLKDLFLKIEESRIVLDQGIQLLQELIKFFKHPTTKTSHNSNRVCIIKLYK